MIDKIKRIVNLRKYEISLMAISAIVYYRWLSFDYLVNGDWMFYYHESQIGKILPSIWKSDVSIGLVDPTPFRSPIESIAALISNLLQVDSNVVDKILYLWPIVFILPVASYLLFKSILSSERGAAVASILFCYNTYFLTIDTAGHNMITDSVVFCILSLYYLFTGLESDSKKRLMLSSLSLAIAGYYDFRMVYITIFIILLLFPILYNKNLKKFLRQALLYSLIFVLLNVFWVLPLLFLSSNFGEGVLDRPLFGDQYWSLAHSLTLMHPFWNQNGVEWFSINDIPLHFWILPILIFFSLYIGRRNLSVKLFTVMYLIGVFLTKQSDMPLGQVYEWLYNYFPGFNAFRESTKFYYITALSSAVLIGFLVKNTEKYKITKLILSILVSCLFLFNTLPLITGRINHMFVNRVMDQDYTLLNDYINLDKDPSRILWMPVTSVFAPYTQYKTSVSMINLFTLQMIKESEEFDLEVPGLEDVRSLMDKSYFNRIIDSAGIRLVSVPSVMSDSDIELFDYYGGSDNSDIYNSYVDLLSNFDYLSRADIGQNNLMLYSNSDRDMYISTSDNLIQLDSFKNLDSKYKIIRNINGERANFYTKGDTKIESDKLIDLAEIIDVSRLDMSRNLITIKSNIQNGDNLIKAPANLRYSARRVDNKLLIYQQDTTDIRTESSDNIMNSSKEIKIAEVNNDIDYIRAGERLTNVNQIQNPVGYVNDVLSLVKVSQRSTIPNGSFEFGPWKSEVDNCNNFDNSGKVSQRLSDESKVGNKSLELSAVRHTACTNSGNIEVLPGSEYLLSINYKSDNSNQVGLYISAREDSDELMSDIIPVENSEWNTYTKIVRIPDDIKNIKLYIYAYGNMQDDNVNSVLYDNLKLNRIIENKNVITTDNKKVVTHLFNNQEKLVFNFADKYVDMFNKIDNGDFSKGLWENQVRDCNNYDDEGDIEMYISREHASTTNNTLTLVSAKHDACTSTDYVPVRSGATYMISFDYRSNIAGAAGYYVDYGDQESPNIQETLISTSTEWQSHSRTFRAPSNADRLSLGLYAIERPDDVASVSYDNVKLIEIPNIENKYYVFNSKGSEYKNPASVTFEWINQHTKRVSIRGATTPFYLNMSEAYHPDWRIKVGGTYIDNINHYKLNGFLNGWYINPMDICAAGNAKVDVCNKNENGEYSMDLIIEFVPQKWYIAGIIFTIVSIILVLIYFSRKTSNNIK